MVWSGFLVNALITGTMIRPASIAKAPQLMGDWSRVGKEARPVAESVMNLRRDYALPFAAWELRLYLNTHPQDRCALKQYQALMDQLPDGNYAALLQETPCAMPTESALTALDAASNPGDGSLCAACAPGSSCPIYWEWLEGPWPWECGCGQ